MVRNRQGFAAHTGRKQRDQKKKKPLRERATLLQKPSMYSSKKHTKVHKQKAASQVHGISSLKTEKKNEGSGGARDKVFLWHRLREPTFENGDSCTAHTWEFRVVLSCVCTLRVSTTLE